MVKSIVASEFSMGPGLFPADAFFAQVDAVVENHAGRHSFLEKFAPEFAMFDCLVSTVVSVARRRSQLAGGTRYTNVVSLRTD